MTGGAFFDTNVPLCRLAGDAAKASRAEDLLAEGGAISVQVLSEFVAVARRKLATPWDEVEVSWAALRHVCRVGPSSARTHERAVALAKHYGLASGGARKALWLFDLRRNHRCQRDPVRMHLALLRGSSTVKSWRA